MKDIWVVDIGVATLKQYIEALSERLRDEELRQASISWLIRRPYTTERYPGVR